MLIPSRRFSVLILLAVLSAGRAGGQELSSVKIVEDLHNRQVMDVGRDLIRGRAWIDAVEVLQKVLDEKQDRVTRVMEPDPADPKKTISVVRGVKSEANKLIGSMPADGLQAYEATYGAAAQKMLDAAAKKKDVDLLAEVALRYRHTKAGREAQMVLAKSGAFESPKIDGWPSWRGNASNTAQAYAKPPNLDKKLWSRPIMLDVLEGARKVDPDEPAKKRIDAAIKQMRDLKQPVLPGFFPIVAQGMVVYRTQRDIRAVALKKITIKDAGEEVEALAGQIHWKTIDLRGSLSELFEKQYGYRGKVDQWLDEYQQVPGLTSILYDNTLIGSLSTDGRNVYLIDDLAVPPSPRMFEAGAFKDPPFFPGDLKLLLMQNRLEAYDLVNGKINWYLGWDRFLNENEVLFKNSHFLSAPISVGGKLFVLNEKLLNPNVKGPNPVGGESALRLICIDPSKVSDDKKPAIIGPPLVLGKIVQKDRFVQDMSRRVNAAAPAYADGILVCPTNAGEVFGIELPTRSFAWAYSYRESAPQPIALPGMMLPKGVAGTTVLSKWKSSPPVIADGKVVFTAPDADSVHCVNLRDGKPLWKKKQHPGDLYLAGVFAGRVLIVADKTIRALDLKDGSPLWSIDTGDLPSGQGSASNGVYYLPLEKEILAVDLAKGKIKAHHRVPAGGAAPGNLVFYGDMLLSQTATDVTAYPQGKEK